METSKPEFDKYLFVCVNERPKGERISCGGMGCGKELAVRLKEEVKKAGFASKIRVSKSYCLDVCEDGPNVIIFPGNVWFKKADIVDIPVILKNALETNE